MSNTNESNWQLGTADIQNQPDLPFPAPKAVLQTPFYRIFPRFAVFYLKEWNFRAILLLLQPK